MTEQQPYRIVHKYADFQVRRYPEHLLAEVVVEGSFEEAGNKAFRYLFAYLGGENRSSKKVAMTAPVVQDAASEKIQMTAPVVQQGEVVRRADETAGGTQVRRFRVAFVLPADFTIDTAPLPTNPRVLLRVVPESLAAVISFSGRWSNESYQRHLDTLEKALGAAGLCSVGAPRFARFDPPIKPWFLRRNEIILDLDNSPGSPTGE